MLVEAGPTGVPRPTHLHHSAVIYIEIFLSDQSRQGGIIFPHNMAGYGHPYVIHAANLAQQAHLTSQQQQAAAAEPVRVAHEQQQQVRHHQQQVSRDRGSYN